MRVWVRSQTWDPHLIAELIDRSRETSLELVKIKLQEVCNQSLTFNFRITTVLLYSFGTILIFLFSAETQNKHFQGKTSWQKGVKSTSFVKQTQMFEEDIYILFVSVNILQ